MNKDVLVREILKGMEYKEDIRNGIWVNNNPDYQELFFYAHGGMLPDDCRYRMIHDILCNMVDDDDDEDPIDMLDSLVPVYTDKLTAWLYSSTSRLSYCDQYLEEYDEISDTISLLSGGYMMELQEVYALINEWLDENTDEE